MADYKNYTLEELIEHCKSINIPYMSKRNKVYIEKTLIKNIRKYENTMREALGDINEIIVSQDEDDVYDEKLNVIVNEIIWTISKKNAVIDDKYKNIKDNLQQVIKMCHNILYGNAIVGVKAQNDIMKILTIHIFKSQFADENSELFKICKKFLNDGEMSQERYDKYMGYCKNIKEFLKTDNPLNEWRMFIMSFAIKIFKNSIYNEEDCRFSFNDEASFMKLIDVICKIEINEDFVDAFATSYGDVHEAFREYGGGKGSKELGQFFSPRHLINIIFHGCGFNDIIKSYENPTIYDCCMGTGGLLTRAYSNGNIIPGNIYGCEVEKDTIKFGECSIFLTTNNFNSNIIKCDSLCENPYLITNKFDIIFTNPPFGTSMNYKALQKRFDYFKKDDTTRFEDIYPISVNNGTSLFIQHCIYMLKEGGVCAIILPHGELFDSTSFIKLRKYMCESVNVLKIIYVPPKTFSHTSIETAVIIFKKESSTKHIEFMEITTKECESIKSNMIVPIKNIKNNNYNFKISSYTKTEQIQYGEDVIVKTLGEVCEIVKGEKKKSKDGKESGLYPLYYCSILGNLYLDTYDYTGEGIIINKTNGSGKAMVYFGYDKYNVGETTLHFKSNDSVLYTKYVYYYLFHNIELLQKYYKGANQKSIVEEDLFKIKIPIPSLERQDEIIGIYENIAEEHKKYFLDKIEQENEHIEMLKKIAISLFNN